MSGSITNQNHSNDNKRIVKNTIFLYMRSIVILLISLYTSRIVLKALGIDDYGLYNVVGGFVGMFSILSSSLVNASQRFISFEMGQEKPNLNKVFCGTVSTHIFLTVGILIVFETFGLWFLNNKLNIAEERMVAANWVYQCSVLSFCINLLNVPFNASIIAHERMGAFAYISIYEVIAKLLIVYLLYLTNSDKLIAYSILILLVSISLQLVYAFYSRSHFEECRYHFELDKPFIRSLLSFTGWNFLGSTASVLVTQGVNLLINIFFGVALNAARGIAEQVNNAVNQFVTNMMTAMNPQITKSYSSGDYSYMNNLMVRGSKYATLLFGFLSLPIFINVDFILNLWLVEVPAYAPLFLRLAIIFSVFQSLSNTLYIGMLATGNIKKYQIIMSSIYIASFVLCYIVFKLGFGPEWGYLSTIIAVSVGMFVRLILLRQMIEGFSIRAYFFGALSKSVGVILLSGILGAATMWCMPFSDSIKFIISSFICIISIAALSYFFAFDSNEKKIINNYMKKYRSRLIH